MLIKTLWSERLSYGQSTNRKPRDFFLGLHKVYPYSVRNKSLSKTNENSDEQVKITRHMSGGHVKQTNKIAYFYHCCIFFFTTLHFHFALADGLDENLEGLIDDNPDLENEESGSGSDAEDADKRKHEESELDEDLSDDDYALIEENLGIKVKRKVVT